MAQFTSKTKQMIIKKYLPHNFLAEKMILSCLLINSEAIDSALQTISIETFYFNIYNRSSDLVYTTTDINDLKCMSNDNGWDGLHYQTGNKLPFGTYVYEIYFQDFEGWKHQEYGEILLVR